MKYLPLIWAGIWRKRSRALLMLLQIASAFVLFGVLQGLDAGVEHAIAQAHGDRLYIASRVAMGDPLPLSMLARIQSIPGVEYVIERANFGGTYQRASQQLPVIAINAAKFFQMYVEAKTSPGAVRALEHDRTGAIVGALTMRKYGWRIGDHVVIDAAVPRRNGSHAWSFDIVGTYNVADHPTDSVALLANFAYINASRLTNRDHVNFYVAKIASPRDAGAVSLAIDNAFANSAHETRTQSGAELAVTQTQQLGDINFIAHAVVGAVFFALLLATAALMMQSLRERIPELAVLKTLGFSDAGVLALVLTESVVFCIVAAAIGLAIGAALLPLARRYISVALVPGVVFAEGIACAIVLAVVGAWIPAHRAARLQVVDALAGR